MLPKSRKVVPLTRRLYVQEVACALQREFSERRHCVKTLMAWTGASERSASNWLNGRVGPSGEHLINLAANSSAVMTTILRLTGYTEAAKYTDIDVIYAELEHLLEILSSRRLS